jgi:hypothetical protein
MLTVNNKERAMKYIVVIEQDGETARLECDTLEEAERVKVSFENYGRYQNIRIDQIG